MHEEMILRLMEASQENHCEVLMLEEQPSSIVMRVGRQLQSPSSLSTLPGKSTAEMRFSVSWFIKVAYGLSHICMLTLLIGMRQSFLPNAELHAITAMHVSMYVKMTLDSVSSQQPIINKTSAVAQTVEIIQIIELGAQESSLDNSLETREVAGRRNWAGHEVTARRRPTTQNKTATAESLLFLFNQHLDLHRTPIFPRLHRRFHSIRFLRRQLMKGCLKHCHSLPPSPPSLIPADALSISGRAHRKCVAFCARNCNQVFVADEWDRSPAEMTPRLSYEDMLELKQIQLALPRATQPPDPELPSDRPATPQYLSRVPLGLLPLLPQSASLTPQSSSPQSSPTTNPPAKFSTSPVQLGRPATQYLSRVPLGLVPLLPQSASSLESTPHSPPSSTSELQSPPAPVSPSTFPPSLAEIAIATAHPPSPPKTPPGSSPSSEEDSSLAPSPSTSSVTSPQSPFSRKFHILPLIETPVDTPSESPSPSLPSSPPPVDESVLTNFITTTSPSSEPDSDVPDTSHTSRSIRPTSPRRPISPSKRYPRPPQIQDGLLRASLLRHAGGRAVYIKRDMSDLALPPPSSGTDTSESEPESSVVHTDDSLSLDGDGESDEKDKDDDIPLFGFEREAKYRGTQWEMIAANRAGRELRAPSPILAPYCARRGERVRSAVHES
ncbi:hypothetical protein EW146_g4788 [Bondarzewia mesenterica]|uniref:Uncharacterized protein n=1 Tax=Bondarzewia mesenterica TaxID=1095465 RepID=A0A4S4LTI0_9AGAM|nr:hypothetical protein EW146_g4788 [Bondarzewia mesenterica]